MTTSAHTYDAPSAPSPSIIQSITHIPCRTTFCSECIGHLRLVSEAEEIRCPLCRGPAADTTFTIAPLIVQAMLDELEVVCTRFDVVLSRQQTDQHLSSGGQYSNTQHRQAHSQCTHCHLTMSSTHLAQHLHSWRGTAATRSAHLAARPAAAAQRRLDQLTDQAVTAVQKLGSGRTSTTMSVMSTSVSRRSCSHWRRTPWSTPRSTPWCRQWTARRYTVRCSSLPPSENTRQPYCV